MSNKSSFDIKIVNNSAQIKKELRAELAKRMTMACMVAQASIKTNAPHDTGELRDKIDYNVTSVGGKIFGQVGSPTIYAPYVEFGTGEFAENGAGLKGGWRYKTPDGKWHYTIGMKPRKFMRTGFRSSKEKILSVLGKPIKTRKE